MPTSTNPHPTPPKTMQFQWDAGNLAKLETVNKSGRTFTIDETESAFSDPNRVIETSYPDSATGEARYKLTGLSNQNQVICVIFVLRDGQIRIFNVWKAKQTALRNYHAQTTDSGGEKTVRGETTATDGEGDQPPREQS